jgi:hypothetical protein
VTLTVFSETGIGTARDNRPRLAGELARGKVVALPALEAREKQERVRELDLPSAAAGEHGRTGEGGLGRGQLAALLEELAPGEARARDPRCLVNMELVDDALSFCHGSLGSIDLAQVGLRRRQTAEADEERSDPALVPQHLNSLLERTYGFCVATGIVEAGESSLTGTFADQAALHGLLDRRRDLGIQLVSVNPVTDGKSERSIRCSIRRHTPSSAQREGE